MPLIHHSIKHFIRIIGTVGLCLLIVASFGAWRLSKGPVALDFLTGYIEEALSPIDSDYSVKIDSTVLTWGKGIRPLDIRAVGLKIMRNNEVVVATMPAISVSLSGRALLKGNFAPRTIEITEPNIRLFRKANGEISFGLDSSDKQEKDSRIIPISIMKPLIGVLTPLGSKGQTKYLKRIEIVNAKLAVEDIEKGSVWHMPDVNLEIKRDVYFIMVNAKTKLNLGGKIAEFQLLSRYGFADNEFISKINFENICPADIELPFSSTVNMPLKGEFDAKLNIKQIISNKEISFEFIRNSINSLDFSIKGGKGTLKAPAPINETYELTSMDLKGHFGKTLDNVTIDKFKLEQKDYSVILTGKGSDLSHLIKGNTPEKAKIKLKAEIPFLLLSELPKYWAKSIGASTRKWIFENLSDGEISKAYFSFDLQGNSSKQFEVKKIDGSADIKNFTVHYMKDMPLIKSANGTARFALDRVDIDVSSGQSAGLKITGGKLSFNNLLKKPKSEIELKFSGSVSDSLKIIDSKPLRFAKKLDLVPSKLSGTAITNLKLDFPIAKNLGLDSVSVAVDSQLHNVSIPKVFRSNNLTNGKLRLTLDNKGMDIKGTAMLKTVPIDFNWRENFTSKEFKSRYNIKTDIEISKIQDIGFDTVFIEPLHFNGTVASDVVLTLKENGNGFLGIQADLSKTSFHLPAFGWEKKLENPAVATISAHILNKQLREITKFRISAGNEFILQGKTKGEDKTFDKIEINEFKLGKNDLLASVDFSDKEKIKINLFGLSFDFHQVRQELKKKKKLKTKNSLDDMALDVNVAVNRMFMSKNGYLEKVSFFAIKKKSGWHKGEMTGQTGKDAAFKLSFLPEEENEEEYKISVTSKDAGAALKAFGIFENIKKGTLEIKGKQNQKGIIKGIIKIDDYRLVGAPVFARLLTIASLTGIVDLLSGEGIGFWDLKLPFTIDDSEISIEDASTAGTSIGVTCHGKLNHVSNEADLEGTLIPVYVINSLIGKIPLIGSLLVGGEGEGFFAMNYKIHGNLDNPEITVNPLSVLAPGFLRKFFSSIGEKTEKVDKPKNIKVQVSKQKKTPKNSIPTLAPNGVMQITR